MRGGVPATPKRKATIGHLPYSCQFIYAYFLVIEAYLRRGVGCGTRNADGNRSRVRSRVCFPVDLRARGQGDFPLPGPLPPLSVEHDLGGHGLLTLAAERADEVRELGASGGRACRRINASRFSTAKSARIPGAGRSSGRPSGRGRGKSSRPGPCGSWRRSRGPRFSRNIGRN